jgi:hypothetical protein
MGLPRKVVKGKRPQVGDINRLIDRLDALQREVAGLKGRKLRDEEPALRIYAVNKTGDDLRQGDAAALAGSPYTTIQEMQRNGMVAKLEAFQGSGGRDTRPWAVAENLIENDEGGYVYVAGLCMARVIGGVGAGDYAAAPDGGGAVLERYSEGAPIVQEGDETAEGGGERWDLIDLRPGGGAGEAGADLCAACQTPGTYQTIGAGGGWTAVTIDALLSPTNWLSANKLWAPSTGLYICAGGVLCSCAPPNVPQFRYRLNPGGDYADASEFGGGNMFLYADGRGGALPSKMLANTGLGLEVLADPGINITIINAWLRLAGPL